jgi:hypothetical protein
MKKGVSGGVWFVVIILIFSIICNGLLLYKYIQNKNLVSEKDSFFSSIADFSNYYQVYNQEINILNLALDKINLTEDYTTCMNYVGRLSELDTKYKEDDWRTFAYLKSIVINNECENAISKYSSLINKTEDSRDNYRLKAEKWCYGYHKADWSYTWTEEYSTPWTLAGEELSNNEDNLYNAYSNANAVCLKQIANLK